MTPAEYDAWYRTPRGSWIGELEYRLLRRLLAPAAGESLIDVGCGTGYFTRRFALDGNPVTGIDPDPSMLEVARAHRAAGERYVLGDARTLPFKDGEFDCCVSVTALCFIPEQAAALAEMLRVTRRRIALGLLNRRSILYLKKGRGGGTGAYRGAHWHTAREVRGLFSRMPCEGLNLEYAVFLPAGRRLARCVERAMPKGVPLGGFLAVSADVQAMMAHLAIESR
jgi:SAM-dependent methyltransferase